MVVDGIGCIGNHCAEEYEQRAAPVLRIDSSQCIDGLTDCHRRKYKVNFYCWLISHVHI